MQVRQRSRQERYEEGRNHLDEIKLATGCEACGDARLSVLDFHHLRDKSFNLSGSACAKPLARLDEEIAKCAILCANCHRLAHAGMIVIEEDHDAPDESSGKPCHYAVGYRLSWPRHAGR